MRAPASRLLASIALAFLPAQTGCACHSSGSSDAWPPELDAPDASGDAGRAECPPAEPFGVGGDGAEEPLSLPEGESRAGRLGASMLPEDVTELGVWAAGDFVLASSAGVALLIEDVGESDLYDRFGGRPVGIARVEDGALVDAGDFNEILFGASTFLTATDAVSVIADGSDGRAAIVRASGPLRPIDFAGTALEIFRGGSALEGYASAIDYRMEPGADHVEITLSLESPEVEEQVIRRVLFAAFQASRMPMLGPNGFGVAAGDVAFVAFADEHERTSWALVAPPGRMLSVDLPDLSGISIFSLDRETLPGCGRVAIPLGSIALGRGVNGAQAAATRLRGGETRTITGTVYEADGSTVVPLVHVHASVSGAYHSRTTSRVDGTYSMEVPRADVQVTSWRRGSPPSAPSEVPSAATGVDIRLPIVGLLEVEARVGGVPAPVRVQVIPASGDVLAPPASYGERAVTEGRIHVAFAPDGRVTRPLSPGAYDVIVSRGYEHDLHEERVTIVAGATATVRADLTRVVDTVGWMCADYHIHTTRSPDADDDADLKVLGLVADGLEIAVRSEHEFADDFAPSLARLGLERWALGLAGEEITTWTWGHFGVFPLVVDDTARNGGIPSVYGDALPPSVFEELRGDPARPALIINHPRQTGPGFGYFTLAGYDRATGTVERPELWDESFSLIEVFTDSSFDANRDATVADWFSFLSRGRRVFAVGSSDSHHIYGAPVGYPRTCLDLGTDDVAAVTPAMVRDATEAGRSYVSGGISLDVTADRGTAGPGQTVRGAGETASLHVRVQAADWIDADELELIVDGEPLMTMPLVIGADPIVRFEGDLEVPVARAGSWALVHVRAATDMERLHPGRRPFAVSNPIFFER